MDHLAEHACVGGPLDGEVVGEVQEDPVTHKVELPLFVGMYTMGLSAGGPLRAQYFSCIQHPDSHPHYCSTRYRLGSDGRLYYHL